jgi:hypothetical protein
MDIDATAEQVRLVRPHLPSSLEELRIHNLEVAGGRVDLLFVRYEDDVSVRFYGEEPSRSSSSNSAAVKRWTT